MVSTMEKRSGIIRFTGDRSGTAEERPYIPVSAEVSHDVLSGYILDEWKMSPPDIIISLISGVCRYKHLSEEYINAFQNGIIKVISASNTWITTHGFHVGFAKRLGEAIRDEQDRRAVSLHRHRQRYNKTFPRLAVIGVAPDFVPKDLESESRMLVSQNDGAVISQLEREQVRKYDLNQHHTHFLLVDASRQGTVSDFRFAFERELQKGLRQNETVRNGTSCNRRPDSAHNVSKDQSCVPLVGLLLQGGPHEVQQTRLYVHHGIPVIIVKGSGFAADLLSYGLQETTKSDNLENDLEKITPDIEGKIKDLFPKNGQRTFAADMERCREDVVEILRSNHRHDYPCLYVLDSTKSLMELANLDLHVLRTLSGSQSEKGGNWREHLKRDLTLCMKWNRVDFARERIARRMGRVKYDWDEFRLALLLKNREEFVDIMLRKRFMVHNHLSHEALLDLFLSAEDSEFFSVNVLESLLEYPCDTIVGESFVIEDINYIVCAFTGVGEFVDCYELSANSTGVSSADSNLAERKALHALILWSVLMGRREMTKVLWKYVEDPVPMAVFVSALWSGLSRFCREPETQKSVLKWAKDFDMMGMEILGMGYAESLDRTFCLLDRRLVDFGRKTLVQMAYDSRNRWFIAHPCCQKWINNLYTDQIQIVNRRPGLPEIPECFKIWLSAFFIFPMLFWIRFPTVNLPSCQKTRRSSDAEFRMDLSLEINAPLEQAAENGSLGNDSADSRRYWLMQVQDKQRAAKCGKLRPAFFRRLLFRRDATQNQPSLFSRVKMLWCAPVTKFWTFQLFYWLYLALLCVVTLMPVCSRDIKHLFYRTSDNETGGWRDSVEEVATPISAFDAIVWMWTALIAAETFFQNFRRLDTRHFTRCLEKIGELLLMLTFLIAYFMVRVIGQQPRLVSAFSARVIMCIGLLYFSYRLIGVFFPMSCTLGPMLVRIKYMIGEDFVNYLKLIAPFILAGGVASQAIMFPDMALSPEVVRVTFNRAFFTLFTTQPISELETPASCSGKRWSPIDGDLCHAGDFKDPACPTIGFWAYAVVIQFVVILKLVLVTLLYALFTATQLQNQADADAIWKFERYSVVMDFATRSPIPPPFSAVYYFGASIRWLYRRIRRLWCAPVGLKKNSSKQLRGARQEDFRYWKGLVREYLRQQEKSKKDATCTFRASEKVGQIEIIMAAQNNTLREIKDRLGNCEKSQLKPEELEIILDRLERCTNAVMANGGQSVAV